MSNTAVNTYNRLAHISTVHTGVRARNQNATSNAARYKVCILAPFYHNHVVHAGAHQVTPVWAGTCTSNTCTPLFIYLFFIKNLIPLIESRVSVVMRRD